MIMICFAILFVFSLFGYMTKVSVDKAFEKTIDERLYNITHPKSGIAASSNPYDYKLRAFATGDYQYIVSKGKKSLKYMLKKFASSDKNGLEEYIMAMACSSILDENRLDNSWSSGREWYENYIKKNK